MKRRAFVGGLAAGALALGARPILPPEGGAGRGVARHWAWAHGGGDWSAAEWQSRFARLRAAGFEGVHVGGTPGGVVYDAAHKAGLTCSRWTWTLNRSGDAWVKAHHPEWFTVSREGHSSLDHPPYVGYYQWLCPTRQAVRAYLRDTVAEIASDPRVDMVHLDYVRHCDVILPRGLWAKYGLVQDHEMAEFDFCYCEACRSSFMAEGGGDPLGMQDPAADLAWRQFRWDSVTRLVRELADTVHGAGKRISAAVFPTPALARALVRQSWDEWPLDAVFPMLYHRFYEEDIRWIGACVAEGKRALTPAVPLFAGLYLPDLTPTDLLAATRSATAAGATGVSVFELHGLTDAHLDALAA